MAKEVVTINEENLEKALKYDELLSKLRKYEYRLDSDYKFYKKIYVDHIDTDKSTSRQQANYESYKKQLENLRYYFHNELADDSSENIDTEVKDEELPF